MENEKKERRSFLKHILAGSAVVAGATSAIKPARAGTKKIATGDEVLYNESESFKKYYDSLRS